MNNSEDTAQKKTITPAQRKFRRIRNTAFALAAASILYVAHRSNVRQEKIRHQEAVLTEFIDNTAKYDPLLDKNHSYIKTYGHMLFKISDKPHSGPYNIMDNNNENSIFNADERITYNKLNNTINKFMAESGKGTREKECLVIICRLNLALANEKEHLIRKQKFLPEAKEILKTITENRAAIGEEKFAEFSEKITELNRIIDEPHKRNIDLIKGIAEITSKYKDNELHTTSMGGIIVLGKRDYNIW